MSTAEDGPGGVPEEPFAPGERRRALSGGMWNAAATVLPMVTTLVLSVVINRTLGIDAQGVQNFIAYVASLAVALPVMSLFSASVQALSTARGRGSVAEAAWLARVSLLLHVCVGVVSGGVLLAIGLARGDEQVAWAIAGATVGIDAASWALSARSIARDGWGPVGARRLVTQAAAPLLGIVALLAGLGVTGVFLAQAVASVALLVSVWWMQRDADGAGRVALRKPPLPLRPLAALVGMFALVSLLTQVVDRRLEILFLDAYSTEREIAVYSIAFAFVSMAYYVCTSTTGAASSSIAAVAGSGDAARVEQAISRAARVLVAVAVLLAAALASVGPSLVRVVYEGADRAAVLVPWLCLTLLYAPLGHLVQQYWQGVGRLGPILVSGSAGAVVDVALAFLLVPDHGAAGAVAANVTAQAVTATLLVVHTGRRLPGLRLPAGGVLRAAAVAVPSGVAAVAAAGLGGWLGFLSAAAAFVVVAFVLSRVVPVLAADDVAWLEGALPGRLAGLSSRLLTPGRLRGARGRDRSAVGPGGGDAGRS